MSRLRGIAAVCARALVRGVRAAVLVLMLLCVAGGLLLAWRVATYGQTDDEARMRSKQAYLAGIDARAVAARKPPNIVFVLFDDLGYGDIGVGAGEAPVIHTPTLDRLAHAGVMLSDFYAPAPVCTPSRAGYLTGRLAGRAGLPYVVFPSGSIRELLFSRLINPHANHRLPAEEITLAELLSAAGYATGMIGKWHLGDRSPSLPNERGFDRFFGSLYSNDMQPFALYRDNTVAVEAPADQRLLTEAYSREAVAFIEASTDRPFFLYFAHNAPHDPLSVRESRAGGSDAGLFGDVMEEADAGLGQLVAALERSGRLDDTLIVVSSDNGPWFLGSAGDQRGRKGSTFEGGMRVPFIAHWPAGIPGGRVESAMAMGTDLLPTVLEILGLPPPPDRLLDGRSILGVLRAGSPSPHEYLYYADGETLFAVRDRRFKYRAPAGVLYATDESALGFAVPQQEWLFDLALDRRESWDTSLRHPGELQRLRAALEAKQRETGANPRGWR